jgi:hypothetical protein
MEASMAAGAMGAEGGEAAEAQGAPGVDLSPVLERIDQVGGRLEQFETMLGQMQPPADEGDEGADDALAALADLYGGLQEQGAGIDAETASRLVDGLVEQRLGAQLNEVLGPVIQQVESLRANSDAQSLLTAFPEMSDMKVAEAVVQQATAAAQALGVPPELARRPGFIELVYKSQKFDQRAAGEVPVGDLQHQVLEAGGGASPRGGQQTNTAQEILAARSGNSFWGT